MTISLPHVSSTDMQHFTVNIYGNETHEISPILYGLFFEEVLSQSLATLALLCSILKICPELTL